MKDWFEILQEEARAHRASLRDDGEPLELALERYHRQPLLPPRNPRRLYLPAVGTAIGALCISAAVIMDFEGRIQRTVQAAECSASPLPAPPTFVLGDSPATHFASKRYDAPVQPQVINTLPVSDQVAMQLKKDDPRMLEPMYGTWQRAKLRRVANEIMMRSGIVLTVDPELAEERVTIYAGDKTSTLQVLRGIAHLYGSGWFRSETGPPYTYRLRRFDTPQTQGWLNALYQAPQRHAPGMETVLNLSAPTHMEWLERLHKETKRTIISDDTGLYGRVTDTGPQPLFQALCTQASRAGQLWDSHAGTLTFRKAPPIGESLLPVPLR